jgi:hypothetical protein
VGKKEKGKNGDTEMIINVSRPVGENVIGDGEEGSLVDQGLGGFEESKPIRVGKCGWKSVERESQWRRGGRTSIADEAHLPTETPMCALSSRDQVLCRCGHRLWWGRDSHRDPHGFGADHFEPGAPDLTAWPILPKDWLGWQGIVRLGER